jgi:heparin binding hemagglutinin HbhA
VKQYSDLAVAQTRTLAEQAKTPFLAVVGAGDLAVENIKELPTQVVAQATTFVPRTTALVTELPNKAFSLYGELVERGQKLVTSIRRSSATQQAEAQIKVAKSQAKAATTSATKAAKATAKAMDKAADKIG